MKPARHPMNAHLECGILAVRPEGPTATSRGQRPICVNLAGEMPMITGLKGRGPLAGGYAPGSPSQTDCAPEGALEIARFPPPPSWRITSTNDFRGRCPRLVAVGPSGHPAWLYFRLTHMGQRPRMAVRNGMRPGGGAGNRTASAANFVADSAPNPFPGALPPASGHWPFGPFRRTKCLADVQPAASIFQPSR